jgi:hypothetical protein
MLFLWLICGFWSLVHFVAWLQDQSSFSSSRQSAIRIKYLPAGTVQFETITEKNMAGVIGKEAPSPPSGWGSRSPTKTGSQVCFLDLYLPTLTYIGCLSCRPGLFTWLAVLCRSFIQNALSYLEQDFHHRVCLKCFKSFFFRLSFLRQFSHFNSLHRVFLSCTIVFISVYF